MIAAMQINVFFIGYGNIIYLKTHYCNEFDSQEIVKNSQKIVQNDSLHIDVSDLYYFIYFVDGDGKMTEELENQVRFFISNRKYKKNDNLRDAITGAIRSAYGTAKRTCEGVKNSNNAITEFQKKVIHYFESNSFPESQKDFNEKHKELCKAWKESLRNNENTGDNLFYGKAQKVVNMMFKYMYCYSYLNDFSIPEEAFKYCHMTLDSVTLRWISDRWDDGKEIITSKTEWSKLSEYEDYEAISKIVEANEYKLEPYTKFEAEFFIWDYEQLKLFIESLKKVKKSYEKHENVSLKSIASKTEEYIKNMEEISKELVSFYDR